MFGIDDAIALGIKVLDKVIPDPAAKAEAQQKLLELQQSGELKLEEFIVQKEKISADDRDSARKMQIETHSFVPAVLACVVIISAFSIIAYVLSGHVILTGEQGLVVGTIIGGVMGYVTQVLNYFFGSTSSSKSKDATIQNMMQKS